MSIQKRKLELQKELKLLNNEENLSINDCLKEIKSTLKKELKQLADACDIKEIFSLKVNYKVEVDCEIYPFQEEVSGNVYVDAEEPKGYSTSCFLCEDSVGNVGVDYESVFRNTSPHIASQISKKKKLEKNVKEKVLKITKKYGLKWVDVHDEILEMVVG